MSYTYDSYSMIIQAMKRNGYQSAMISMIQMYKEKCMNKEQMDIEFGNKQRSGK